MNIEHIATVARAIVTVVHEDQIDTNGWLVFQDQIMVIRRDLKSAAVLVQLKTKNDQLQEVLFITIEGSVETFQSGRTAIYQNWINYLDELLKHAVEKASLMLVQNWRTQADAGFEAYAKQVQTITEIALQHDIREREPEPE